MFIFMSGWRSSRQDGNRDRGFVAGQGFQKRGQILGFLFGQPDGLDFRRQRRATEELAARIMLDNALERGDRAIMHVGRALGYVAQAGRLEGVHNFRNVGQKPAASDVVGLESDVMETLIGEVPARMADRTVRLPGEEGEAPL